MFKQLIDSLRKVFRRILRADQDAVDPAFQSLQNDLVAARQQLAQAIATEEQMKRNNSTQLQEQEAKTLEIKQRVAALEAEISTRLR